MWHASGSVRLGRVWEGTVKRLAWYDYITYNVYWLGLSMGSASLTPLILPLLVAQLVAPGFKNTAYGMQRAAGLIVAILVQPAAGLLSDRADTGPCPKAGHLPHGRQRDACDPAWWTGRRSVLS